MDGPKTISNWIPFPSYIFTLFSWTKPNWKPAQLNLPRHSNCISHNLTRFISIMTSSSYTSKAYLEEKAQSMAQHIQQSPPSIPSCDQRVTFSSPTLHGLSFLAVDNVPNPTVPINSRPYFKPYSINIGPNLPSNQNTFSRLGFIPWASIDRILESR